MAELCSNNTHKVSVKLNSEFSVCRKCGLLSHFSDFGLRSQHINLNNEIEPFKLMERMRLNQIPLKCNGERRTILFKLKKLIKQYKYSEGTLNRSIDFTERIFSKLMVPENKKDLVILCCFLLAGINIFI